MKYRIIIIDDSPTTVKSLVECFDWKSLNAEIVGTAFDGVSGRKLILESNPDIIITDINMPNVDGLNMIEQIFEEIENTRVIVITGYDEFKYASRAIKLSVFDFILKPINDNELYVSLERALESIEKDRNKAIKYEQMCENVCRAQLLSLITTPKVNNSYINNLETEYGINFNSYFMVVTHTEHGIAQPLLRNVDEVFKNSEIKVISLIIDDSLVLFCSSDDEKKDLNLEAGKIIQEMIYLQQDFAIGVSDYHNNPKEIRNTYLEAKCMISGSSIVDYENYVGFYGNKFCEQPNRITRIKSKCRQIVSDIELDNSFVDEFYSKLCSEFTEDIKVQKAALFYCFIYIYKQLFKEKQLLEEVQEHIKLIEKIQTDAQLKQSIKNFYNIQKKNNNISDGVLPLVGQVLSYINMHSIDGLRLEDIAAKFYVSPNYLSSIIKKETGKKYHDHVLEARLNVAKQMLDDTRMNINEIAYAVGYENYVSFYSVFKKLEKMTPTEYRMRNYSQKELHE